MATEFQEAPQFVPIKGAATFIVRGSMHQAMLVGEDALDEYLERGDLERGLFVGEGPYSTATVYYPDGGKCAEIHRIDH